MQSSGSTQGNERRYFNHDWSREQVRSHYRMEGPHGHLYRVLEAFDNRDDHLNAGYSPLGWGHWGRKAPVRLVDRLAKRLFRRWKGSRKVLDVGSGRGGPAFRLFQKWDADVIGVDISDYALDRARKRTRSERIHEGLLFKRGSAGNLPIEDGSMTHAIAIESIGYAPDKGRAVGEVHRVLEPKGRFAMAAVCRSGDLEEGSWEFDAYHDFLRAWDFPHLPTANTYAGLLQDAGFTILRVEDATSRCLKPHETRLRRLLACWKVNLLYRISTWYIHRRVEVDMEPIRTQLEKTLTALEADVLEYRLIWAERDFK